jgi:YVTN family beta-propeller protein
VRLPRVLLALLGAGLTVAATLPADALTPAPHAAAAKPTPGVLLPSGRLVTPAGSSYDATRKAGDRGYDLGDFPVGLALSPDGSIAVASLTGRGYGAPHTNGTFCDQHSGPGQPVCPGVPNGVKGSPDVVAPDEGLDVVDLATGKTVQVVAVPTNPKQTGPSMCNVGYNCFGIGVTFSPDGKHVYATGGGKSAIYDFAVNGTTLTLAHTVEFPSPAAAVPGPPVVGAAAGYPQGVRVTPDGKTLLVVDMYDSTIEAFDVAAGKPPVLLAQALLPGTVPGPIPVGYLYDVEIAPDGATAYVTAQGTGTVYVVNVAALIAAGPLTTAPPVPVGPAVAVPFPVLGLNHPTALTITPDGSTLLVTGTDSDNLAIIPLTNGIPGTPTTVPLSVVSRTTLGSSPDAVAVSKDGRTAYVALAGDNAFAVVDLATASVRGYVPTGWYPTGIALGPKDGRIYTLAAKGLGSRYVPGVGGYRPEPGGSLPTGAAVPNGSYYDAENMPGLLTRVTVPTSAALSTYTALAKANIDHAAGLDTRPARSPIPAAVGGTSPITHVVYIVRENRTFDQVFGDLPLKRKDVTGDPHLQLLAAATPNAHAVSDRFAISDSFFSDGEASIQGHWWASSAMTNDYTEKSWRQNYSPRGRPYDYAEGPVTSTPGCSIFQKLAAYQLTHPAFTFQNFGELVGTVMPTASVGQPEGNLCGGAGPAGPGSNPLGDPQYPSQIELTPDDRTRSAEFLRASGLTLDGTDAGNGNSLRNFQFLIMSEDHTTGLGGVQTPRSQVAQNDAAVGQIISALSKSKYWSSTAVFVTEDDSQDGVDSVDGHRNVLLVASPYAKQRSGDSCLPGYVGHVHYDQASVLRTMELMLGVTPLSAYDAGATPLYDLFQQKDSASQLTPADLKAFEVAKAPRFIDETVESLPKSSRNKALIAYSKGLDLVHVDQDEAGIEAALWQSVRDDALPAELSGKLGNDRDEARPVTSLMAPEQRSTVTGLPLRVGAQAACGSPVKLPTDLKPGTTHVGGKGGLAATGAPWRLALGGSGILLLAAAMRRRPWGPRTR